MLNIAFAMKAASIFFRATFRSNRLDYILNEILGRRLGLEWQCLSVDEPLPEGAICLHYGIPGGHLSFPDSGILKDNTSTDWTFSPGFDQFSLFNGHTEIQNDYFGAAFWLLSRFQEQCSNVPPDKHGRFPDEIHFTDAFRQTPVIEYWLEKLRTALTSLGLSCRKEEAVPQFSIDWDNPTAYLQKGLVRQTAGLAAELLRGNIKDFFHRIQVFSGQEKDPYDNLGSRIPSELLKARRIFFWVGDYGKNDKGLSWKNKWYREKIKELSRDMLPGLHPSYASFSHPEFLIREKKRLEEILDYEITANRFHFLRFRLPESYRVLEESGFREDFSMGYSAFPGFRAGTALPFLWFDLKRNRSSQLLIHPFSLMDSSAAFRGKTNAFFLEAAENLLKTGKELGFPVHAIFHNEHPNWNGWENTVKLFSEMRPKKSV
jgi:hypothetical protein